MEQQLNLHWRIWPSFLSVSNAKVWGEGVMGFSSFSEFWLLRLLTEASVILELACRKGEAARERTRHFLNYWWLSSLMEKAMAPHSSTPAWKSPWTEEPGGLQSMRSRRVGHDWATSLSLLTFMHWRRKWQPTPVFLPGESQGWGRTVGHDWSDLQFFFEGLAMFKVYFSHWCFLGSLGAFLLQPFGSTLALVFWLSTSPVFWLLESSFSSPEQWFLYLTFQ